MKENYICLKAKERIIVLRKALVLRSLNTFNSWGIMIFKFEPGTQVHVPQTTNFFFIFFTYFPIMYPSNPAAMIKDRSSTNIKSEFEPDVLIGRSCGTFIFKTAN